MRGSIHASRTTEARMASTAQPGVPAAVPPFEDDDLRVTDVTFWKRLRRHRLAVASIIVLAAMISVAALAQVISPFAPDFIDNAHWNGDPLPPCFLNALACAHHPLGTDELGRDLLSRLFFGARISLTLAVCVVAVELFIGTILGALAGFYGGWVDWAIMRLTDVFLSIPLLPLLLVLTAIVATSSTKAALGFETIVLIIGALSWPAVARLVRASFLS